MDPEPGLSTSGPRLNVTATSPLNMIWPTEGATFSGVQMLAGTLDGYTVTQYEMFWNVDGANWVQMYNAWGATPQKVAWLNADSWAWNGTGPYRIQLQARTKQGKVLATRSASIYVARANLNLFPGATFYVDPYSSARQLVNAWAQSRPSDAALMERIAGRMQADWFGDWTYDIQAAVSSRTSSIAATGALPVYVAYNIPIRDCQGYSGGGAAGASAYRSWISAFAQGIGSRKAVVILEPDALALMDCLSPTDFQTRLDLIEYAVRTLKSQPGVSVYIDAGNAGWHPADVMARRLSEAGVGFADGFALNVSNYYSTAANVAYGEAVSARIGGKHFVVDTSRNGLGGSDPYEWCNAPGRALGSPATAATGHALADAFLWIKRPGESDGPCNGGPSAGGWWADYALELASRMPLQLASMP